jgi:molybdopterin-guanine dinucleotide biosynthesis protein A
LPSTCAILLAGGQSRRFGQDKALATLGGRPFLVRVFESVGGVVDGVWVSVAGAGQEGRYRPLLPAAARFVRDGTEAAGLPGPLVGVATALGQVEADCCLLMACDTPGMTSELAAAIVDGCGPGRAAVAIDAGGFPQPLAAAYPVAELRALLAVLHRLAQGARRMAGVCDLIRGQAAVRLLPPSMWQTDHTPRTALRNVNRPQELAADPAVAAPAPAPAADLGLAPASLLRDLQADLPALSLTPAPEAAPFWAGRLAAFRAAQRPAEARLGGHAFRLEAAAWEAAGVPLLAVRAEADRRAVVEGQGPGAGSLGEG